MLFSLDLFFEAVPFMTNLIVLSLKVLSYDIKSSYYSGSVLGEDK
jgi:hypothetical protein